MVLDWFGSRNTDVADLIARKKYSKAIEVMRAQFKQRPPGVETRLQFVDVLILAGRGKEAVPVLMGLADELTGEGQASKAIGLLKRVEQIEPARPDVEKKLAALVKKEFEAQAGSKWQSAGPVPEIKKPAPAASKVKVTFSQRVAFDLEEIPEEEQQPAPPAVEQPPLEAGAGEPAPSDAPAEPSMEAAAGQPGPPDIAPVPAAEALAAQPGPPEAAPEPATAAPAEEALVASPAGEQAAEPERAVEAPAEGEAEPPREDRQAPSIDPSVTHRIRGAFRRFLSSLPGGEGEEAGAEAEAEPVLETQAAPLVDAQRPDEPAAEPMPKAEPAPILEPTVEPAPLEAVASAAPEVQAEPVVEAEADVTAEPVAAAETESSEPAVLIQEEPAGVPASEPASAAEPEVTVEAEVAPAAEPEVTVEPEGTTDETMSQETFQGQVLDLIEELVQQPLASTAPAVEEPGPDERPVRTRGVAESAQRLVASPLFRELSEAELLAVVRGMRLHTYEAGDIVITEGEGGDSLLVVTSGSVRTFVRNPVGHNFEMGVLQEGDFFGELSSLSGRPRGSTVVATGHTELLELGKKTVDQIARTHPRVREMLENVFIQRASSPEAAAIRAVAVDAASQQRAIEVLEAYFGETRWDPRMRLRLADLLVKAGREDDAVPLLVGLADDLDRAGFPEKAIAILKKIEKLRTRDTEEVNLAPLKKKKPASAKEAAPPPAPKRPSKAAQPLTREQTQEKFSNWIVDVVRDAVAPATPAGPLPPTVAPGYARGLLASPLFEGLSEDELLTLIRELRLLSFDPGDIIITEGEPGQSLFILTAGAVKVSVKTAEGKNVRVTELRAGAFFGEMAAVSGKPRTATVTAAQGCELLELDKAAIEQISARHPRVREVLEEIYIARASSPDTARARTGMAPA